MGKDEKYETIVYEVNQTIVTNLKKMLNARKLSQNKFCQLLAAEKTSITRSYFNRILADPKNISAAFLLSCCDFFGISLENLVSVNFNENEYIMNETEAHRDYLNIKELLEQNQKRHIQDEIPEQEMIETIKSVEKNDNDENYLILPSMLKDTNLVVNPSNILFKGYIQKYYCYYYPTHSSENKDVTNILKGTLQLDDVGDYCKSTLKIDTNTVDDNGNINYKQYVGYAAISPAVDSMNCVMYSDFLCEFCFLIFRHFKLNFGKQDCRIAEVLSSSSAAEERRPTVLRMLLSREPIDDKDLEIIASSFSLNYSTIAINKDKLQRLSEVSEEYRKITNTVIDMIKPEQMLFCKEDDIYKIAFKILKKKELVLEYIFKLRLDSYSYRYNKVGAKADSSVRDILISKGYYKKKHSKK